MTKLERARNAAIRMYADPSDGNIQIDEDAQIAPLVDHRGNQTSYYVQAWVHVRADDLVEPTTIEHVARCLRIKWLEAIQRKR